MVRIKEYKELTAKEKIECLPYPKKVFIPFIQHLGKPAIEQVKLGEIVAEAQLIASSSAKVSSNIHSSVSGKVVFIGDILHPVIGRTKGIVIEAEKREALQNFCFREKKEIEKLTPPQIRQIVFNAGIVGLGGAGFPTHIKLDPPKPIHSFILNGCECEPYLTADHRLMVEKTREIVLGIELVLKCLGAKNAYIAIEDNKPEAIAAFEKEIRNYKFQIRRLRSDYPQGGEKQLIKNVLKIEVPCGALPYDVGVVVHNVATVFAIYEAVYLNKPLYQRVVTVSGDCINAPKNLLVRIGTPIRELIEFCGPLKKNPKKVILGGPMMGYSQYSLDTPVIKTTGGLILLSEQDSFLDLPCIRCGKCVEYCPVGLLPCIISTLIEKKKFELLDNYSIFECIECGSCSFICPQKRNITQQIKQTKLNLRK